MPFNGTVPVNMSGHRKATAIRCNACSAALGHTVWHQTPRGLDPEPCPLETYGLARAVGHSEVRRMSDAPAVVAREKLGTAPRVPHWNVVKLAGLQPQGG